MKFVKDTVKIKDSLKLTAGEPYPVCNPDGSLVSVEKVMEDLDLSREDAEKFIKRYT
jgi:hypothetical protein